MFLLFMIDESQQNSSLLTFGNGVSVTTVLCVVVVTVSLVLMTLLCICRTSATRQITAEQPLVAAADARLSSLQPVTTKSQTEVKEDANHVASDRNSNEVTITLSESASSSSVRVSAQQFLVVQETTSQKSSSPQLPPRNPHRLLSAQSSYSGNPGQPGSAAAAAATASGLPPNAEMRTQTRSLQAFPENVDYEEVDFRPSSVAGQGQTTIADRQYDYIDLKVVKAPDESGAAHAEVGENSENSASSTRADAAVVSRTESETPRYAKVDKARDRHTFSATLLESNASAKVGNSEREVAAGSSQRMNSSSVADLYTEVNKPKSAGTARQSENTAPSGLQGEKLLSEDASGASGRNSRAGSRPLGAGSSDFIPPLTSRNFEEPGYSMIKDELPKTTFEEPGYSEIKDEPKQRSENPGYSVIGEGCSGRSSRLESGRVISEQNKSENCQNDGAAADTIAKGSTVTASASFSREPVYEDIKFDKS